MSLQLRKAERKQAKLRIGLSAPSGAGKTYSALLLASGIASSWDKIALIDTESGSGELYAHLGDYNVIQLEAPFSPERYIEAIQACEEAGMEVIIIDSTSHEWEGKGGCLEINESIAQSKFRGNTWSAWSETTPRHQRFIQAIVGSKCHIITATRNKIDTVMTEDKKVKKVGTKWTSRKLRVGLINKSITYISLIILFFLMDKFILNSLFVNLIKIEYFMTKLLSLVFIFIEFTSIDESYTIVKGKSIFTSVKELIGKANDIKNDLKNFNEDKQ